jgi:hypothetical protein
MKASFIARHFRRVDGWLFDRKYSPNHHFCTEVARFSVCGLGDECLAGSME